MKTRTITHLIPLLQSSTNSSYIAAKLLHAHILRLGLHSNIFLFNRLIELYSKCNDHTKARQVFDHMPQRDVYSWNAMLGAYCKAGKLDYAYKLFDEMPERNAFTWNNMISALSKCGFEEKALGVYHMMVLEGFLPTRFTIASVFSVCGVLLDVQYGRICHGVVVKVGLDRNIYVGNALLGMYAKCWCTQEAVRVFRDIQDPNAVSFSTMMGVLTQTDRVQEAVHMFKLLSRKGISVDPISLSSILAVCSKGGRRDSESGIYDENVEFPIMPLGQQIHGIAVKLGFERDLHFNNSLLGMYTKSGDINSAELIFNNIPEVNVVTWNLMIAGYGFKGQSEKAFEYLQRMQFYGFVPNEVTYINMLTACLMSGKPEIGRQIFDNIELPSVISWNTLLSGYLQSGKNAEAVTLFREMQFRSVRPDRTTFALILGSCAAMGLLESGKQVHTVALKGTIDEDKYVASGLIAMYSKCGKIQAAKDIFNRLSGVDIVCCNSMMSGLALNSLDLDAFTIFKQTQQEDIQLTEFSYATALSCCKKLYSFNGKQVHAQIVKAGHMNDVYVGTALINMYCEFVDVDSARRFFETMPFRNTVTWNEMIHGYAQNGFGEVAVLLYEDMINNGEKPDGITFTGVLTACSHAGLVDTGLKIFNSMQHEHGVEHILDHYTCIIDSLGRAGRLNEAEILVDKIPYRDVPIIWEVLLSSCRVHSNVSLANRAAEELLRLEPQNCAPYVLLANMYASLGRWDEATAIRELMKDSQVAKGPGVSWIDVKNGTQMSLADESLVSGR